MLVRDALHDSGEHFEPIIRQIKRHVVVVGIEACGHEDEVGLKVVCRRNQNVTKGLFKCGIAGSFR